MRSLPQLRNDKYITIMYMGRRLTVFWDEGELGNTVMLFYLPLLSLLSFPMCPTDSMPNWASCFERSYTVLCTQFCRIKGCGGAGCPPPPPIIFETLKLPQQIIYRRKGNLSESPNHQKCWENILVSRFYEQF